MRSRNGANGWWIWFSSNDVSLSTLSGHHASLITPFGVYIKSRRFGGLGASASAWSELSSGNATLMPPTPQSN
ncbi:MAG: hypothetical protein QM756_12100 [Polyangiaceae bacterium]